MGLRKSRIFKMIRFSKSKYYYKTKSGKRGAKASTTTKLQDGSEISNLELVEIIKSILNAPYCDYGAFKVCKELQRRGYLINHKKVYRLMKAHKLLHNQIKRNRQGKEFVKYRKQKATAPYEQLQIDIKYVHVHGEHRNSLLASVIDIYSRMILSYTFAYSIRKYDVCAMMDWILAKYPSVKQATLRSDNGSQFEANLFKTYLKLNDVKHEFTHPATPQENAYIESYHSIISRELCCKFIFDSFDEAKREIDGYIKYYNEERLHSGIGYKSPKQFLQERELDGLRQLPSSALL